MRELSQLEGLHWMRILYAYPSYFTEELIDEIANNPKVCVRLLWGTVMDVHPVLVPLVL